MSKRVAFLLLLLACLFSTISMACYQTYTSSPSSTPTGYLVTTVAGSGISGSVNGTGTAASFNIPRGIAVDSSGNIYVGDFNNSLVRKIAPGAVVTTLAGSGNSSFANGTGTAASFFGPEGVAVDSAGNVYVGDMFNQRVREITPGGVVTTLAGSGFVGSANGAGAIAAFCDPNGVVLDSAGNLYVSDGCNNLIRKITPAGVVSTFAGSGASGSANGTGTAASFSGPGGIAIDSAGNLYIGDTNNNLIRKITSAGIVTTLAGTGAQGAANGTAATASFYDPTGVAVDSSGNVYVADNGNEIIREISAAGMVTTFAGNGQCASVNGPAASSSFCSPWAITVDASGNIFVTDSFYGLIRKIAPN
jgi:serine/threonine protein kinase, bacterial